jgi:hypothetical protein
VHCPAEGHQSGAASLREPKQADGSNIDIRVDSCVSIWMQTVDYIVHWLAANTFSHSKSLSPLAKRDGDRSTKHLLPARGVKQDNTQPFGLSLSLSLSTKTSVSGCEQNREPGF